MNSDNYKEMEDEIAKLKPLLRALAEEEQAQAGEHLEVDRLAAYHFNEISSDEAKQVRDHLVMCCECASLLLDLAELCNPDQEETGHPLTAESEIGEAMWESPSESEPRPAPSLFLRFGERIFTPRFVYLVESLSLALILAFAVWIVSLKKENRGLIDRDAEIAREIEKTRGERDKARANAEDAQAQLTKPQLNIQIKDLLAGMTRARGDSGPVDVELSASATYFALILPAPEREFPDYSIEILDRDGAPVVNEGGLLPDKDAGVFTISLPRALFKPGVYRVNVYGIARGERTRVSGGVARIRYKK